MSNLISVSQADCEDLITKALQSAKVDYEVAKLVASHLTLAEIQGQHGHGISRVKSYREQALNGKINTKAKVQANAQHATLEIDADYGFAYPAIERALCDAPQIAKTYGTAFVTIKNSHHAGVLGLHVERIAKLGMITLMMSNTPSAMAAWGGKTPVFGTNPIAFACPGINGKDQPLVIDLSLSKVARGKVMRASRNGEQVPEGWGLDKNGKATTDPDAILQGSMLPAGGAKGAMLALIVEILTAGITGSNFSFQASSFLNLKGSSPAIAHSILLINPRNAQQFATSIELLLNTIDNSPDVRLPGALRIKQREKAKSEGIPMRMLDFQELGSYKK